MGWGSLKDFFGGSHDFQGQWRQRSVKGMGGGGGTGHRKLISRGGIMKILQSLNSQVLPRSFGRVSRKRLHDGSECFQ